MDGGGGFGGSDFMNLIDNSNHSFWLPSSSHSFPHETMVKFDQEGHHELQNTMGERYRGSDGEEEVEMGNLFGQPEKKRRLTTEQVQFLEINFEKENKLEPERKDEFAKQLGLQPRQVAIWFQNRRARFKTKQLEKEYNSLKATYDQLKLDFDSLLKERHDLQNEVKLLTKKLKQKETGLSDLDPDGVQSEPQQNQKLELEKLGIMGVTSNGKQTEDASSTKSDILDSESPYCIEEGNQPHLEDPVDSTRILDPDWQSDFSQDEEDPELMSLLPSTTVDHDNQDQGSYDLALVDDQPIWPWLY